MKIPGAFRELFDPQHRDYAYYGGRGGAKSHSIAGALVIQAAASPLRIVCAREIQESLRDSVKQLIEDKIADYGLEDHFESLRDETRAKNGGRFVYKGMWRNPDALKSLEGADVFWGEEANRFSGRSIRLIRPTMRKPGSRMIWSWNPEFDHDPVDMLFRGPAGPPPNSIVREVSWKDNPWFADTPLLAEMENDYRVDPAMAAHVWGGEYVSAVDGAYYAAQLAAVRSEGRITALARDPLMRVRAFWDLGWRDATAIWVAQFVGREIRVLDYIEGRGQELGYYVSALRAGGWDQALMELPHDGQNVTVTSSGSAQQQLRAAGFEVNVTPNQGKGAALERVAAARRLFPRIWFNDTPTVAIGIKALAAYHERRDDRRKAGLGPEHDWASDPADAFGLMCIAYQEPGGTYDDEEEWRDDAGRNSATGY
ncbi:PBSX family phage terminase large subunit [Phenylobacterium sp. J367]|uniref:PBSX family phage terminase large subunit n=1 Tax=Phenylobacterium sp. J367 TaxID=2898435 RepID=UPI0021513D02|nr:PBSX family phage terminase large subunit [Phenylobacterium sp. J367]MCR5876943.1 PBSX family phage terminase large subunit [Phenylobacterium sp. J367]MCR5877010.1 PBSX family phage terminase large subunit [Phenylobacterium sp. J367]